MSDASSGIKLEVTPGVISTVAVRRIFSSTEPEHLKLIQVKKQELASKYGRDITDDEAFLFVAGEVSGAKSSGKDNERFVAIADESISQAITNDPSRENHLTRAREYLKRQIAGWNPTSLEILSFMHGFGEGRLEGYSAGYEKGKRENVAGCGLWLVLGVVVLAAYGLVRLLGK